MTLTHDDWLALRLSLQLALLTTVLLLVLGTPLAWWLARTRSRWKSPVAALVAMPIVLPPTVLGFYLLVLLGAEGPLGRFTQALGLGLLPFTFPGLVLASVLYSLPFVVQPVQNAFEAIGDGPLDAAATLRAGPWDRFVHVALPLARPGLLTGAMLVFAHTIGEFGIVLMIGGNIPGRTRVLSVLIYDHVEALEYGPAQALCALLVGFTFLVLLALHVLARRKAADR
jgi:molybdate transport system permease protein